jgi:hypothetical protein
MPKQISYRYIGMASIVVVIAPDSTLSFKFYHLQGCSKQLSKKPASPTNKSSSLVELILSISKLVITLGLSTPTFAGMIDRHHMSQ